MILKISGKLKVAKDSLGILQLKVILGWILPYFSHFQRQ